MRSSETCFWLLYKTSLACPVLTTLSVSASGSKSGASLPWDWMGIIGTGPSLSVGVQGRPLISNAETGVI